RRLMGIILGFTFLLAALIFFGASWPAESSMTPIKTHPRLFTSALLGLVAAYVVAAAWMGRWANRMLGKLRTECAESNERQRGWEYRSNFELLGLPLIHVRFNNSPGPRMPIKAWIAGGECALGMLFAFGGMAIAPLSIGGIAIGLVPWGGL